MLHKVSFLLLCYWLPAFATTCSFLHFPSLRQELMQIGHLNQCNLCPPFGQRSKTARKLVSLKLLCTAEPFDINPEYTNSWKDLSAPEPGCVLVAAPDEVDHFFRRAVVLLLSCDQTNGARGLIVEMAIRFRTCFFVPL